MKLSLIVADCPGISALANNGIINQMLYQNQSGDMGKWF